MELIEKKVFATTTFDSENKAFVVYVAFISQDLNVYPFWRDQVALLKVHDIPTFIPPKYADFVDVFFKDLAAELPKHTRINDHIINLITDQQPP